MISAAASRKTAAVTIRASRATDEASVDRPLFPPALDQEAQPAGPLLDALRPDVGRVAQGVGQGANRNDGQQDPGRKLAAEVEAGDQRQRHGPHEVIERDQPNPSVAVEQGAGDRAQRDARSDR